MRGCRAVKEGRNPDSTHPISSSGRLPQQRTLSSDEPRVVTTKNIDGMKGATVEQSVKISNNSLRHLTSLSSASSSPRTNVETIRCLRQKITQSSHLSADSIQDLQMVINNL